MSVYVFEAQLDWDAPVSRKLALPAARTLDDLHHLIREAFGWEDDHLYSFWLDGEFWGDEESEYTAPDELDEQGAKSARYAMNKLGLEAGQQIAYVFDFGEEWRIMLELGEIREGGDTGILESVGEAPYQYPNYDDDH